MQKYENVKRNLKEIIINNFLGGIAWALGATIGVTIVLTIIGFIANNINFIPIIGNFAAQISEYVSKNTSTR